MSPRTRVEVGGWGPHGAGSFPQAFVTEEGKVGNHKCPAMGATTNKLEGSSCELEIMHINCPPLYIQ